MVITLILGPSSPFLASESSKGTRDVYNSAPVANFFLAWSGRGLHSPGTGLLSIAEGWLISIYAGMLMVVGIGSAVVTVPLTTAFDRDERYRK